MGEIHFIYRAAYSIAKRTVSALTHQQTVSSIGRRLCCGEDIELDFSEN